MAGAEIDIKIYDGEYETLSKNAAKFSDAVEDMLADYLSILDDIFENSGVEGDAAENLRLFARWGRKMQGDAEDVIKVFSDDTAAYIEQIDVDDKELY